MLQAGVVGGQAGLAVAVDGALHVALAPVVGRQREVPVAELRVQLLQVVERGAGRGQHVAAVVAEQVLLQLEVLAGGGHELPHARGPRAGDGLRVEGALDEGQQGQLAGHAAPLDLFDDVEQVAAAALGHALHVVGAAGVPLLPLAHQVAFQRRHGITVAHALPEVAALGVAVRGRGGARGCSGASTMSRLAPGRAAGRTLARCRIRCAGAVAGADAAATSSTGFGAAAGRPAQPAARAATASAARQRQTPRRRAAAGGKVIGIGSSIRAAR